MRGPHIHRRLLFSAAALLAAGVAACSSGSAATSGGTTGQGPEVSTVTVYSLDTPDTVPVWIAQQDGFFKQEGLTVKLSYVAGTADTQAGLAAHTVDFALENYVSAFSEEAQHPQLGLKIIAEDEQQGPNTQALMVAKNSKITSLAGLKGKIIAFPSPGFGLGTLELDEEIKGYGLGPNSYTQDAMGFPNMITPLARGEIGAAYSIQPFITIMETTIGARALDDLNSGADNDLPSVGWGTSEFFLQHDPRTVAAFQRAIEKGQQVAAADPALVRKLLTTKISGMTTQIANVIALQTFLTTLSATRLQRVVDVMDQFGALPKNFNVKSMIVPLPPGA